MTVPNDASFSLETLTLPHEDRAEHRRIEKEWMTAYPCTSPIETGFLRQAMVAEIEKRRVERVLATVRAERVRTAVQDFEYQQEDEVVRCQYLVSESSATDAMRELLRFAGGCRWAIAQCEKLQTALATDGTWYGADRHSAVLLQGFSACLDQLYFKEEVYMTWLDCPVTQPNPNQADINIILDRHYVPKALQERDVKRWPGNPAESRAWLQSLVDRELPRLKALEKTLREEYEKPARAAAREMALAQVTKDERALLHAERIHEQSYAHTVNALLKVRKQVAAAPVPMVERERDDPRGTGAVPRGLGAWGLGKNQATPGDRSNSSAWGPDSLTEESSSPPLA